MKPCDQCRIICKPVSHIEVRKKINLNIFRLNFLLFYLFRLKLPFYSEIFIFEVIFFNGQTDKIVFIFVFKLQEIHQQKRFKTRNNNEIPV